MQKVQKCNRRRGGGTTRLSFLSTLVGLVLAVSALDTLRSAQFLLPDQSILPTLPGTFGTGKNAVATACGLHGGFSALRGHPRHGNLLISLLLRGFLRRIRSASPRAPNAFHDEFRRSRRIQHIQFILAEQLGKQKGTKRDQEEDEDGEAYCRDGLGNGKGGSETKQFDHDKVPDG